MIKRLLTSHAHQVASGYLVGVVCVDEVERTGRGAAERRGSATVRLLGVRLLLRFGTVRQLAEWRKRRRGQDGGRHRGEAAQAIGHSVRVEPDLSVVEVLLTIAAVQVTGPPTRKRKKRRDKQGLGDDEQLRKVCR